MKRDRARRKSNDETENAEIFGKDFSAQYVGINHQSMWKLSRQVWEQTCRMVPWEQNHEKQTERMGQDLLNKSRIPTEVLPQGC